MERPPPRCRFSTPRQSLSAARPSLPRPVHPVLSGCASPEPVASSTRCTSTSSVFLCPFATFPSSFSSVSSPRSSSPSPCCLSSSSPFSSPPSSPSSRPFSSSPPSSLSSSSSSHSSSASPASASSSSPESSSSCSPSSSCASPASSRVLPVGRARLQRWRNVGARGSLLRSSLVFLCFFLVVCAPLRCEKSFALFLSSPSFSSVTSLSLPAAAPGASLRLSSTDPCDPTVRRDSQSPRFAFSPLSRVQSPRLSPLPALLASLSEPPSSRPSCSSSSRPSSPPRYCLTHPGREFDVRCRGLRTSSLSFLHPVSFYNPRRSLSSRVTPSTWSPLTSCSPSCSYPPSASAPSSSSLPSSYTFHRFSPDPSSYRSFASFPSLFPSSSVHFPRWVSRLSAAIFPPLSCLASRCPSLSSLVPSLGALGGSLSFALSRCLSFSSLSSCLPLPPPASPASSLLSRLLSSFPSLLRTPKTRLFSPTWPASLGAQFAARRTRVLLCLSVARSSPCPSSPLNPRALFSRLSRFALSSSFAQSRASLFSRVTALPSSVSCLCSKLRALVPRLLSLLAASRVHVHLALPPLPPLASSLRGLLFLVYVSDVLFFRGALAASFAFDMQKEVDSPHMFFPLLQFFSRAARSAVVHANLVHLLVNLRGISQIFPLCETLCYDALFGAYTPPSSSCVSASPLSPFSLFSLSDALPLLREGLVWRDAGKAAGRASCVSALSSDESARGVARWCWWGERGGRGPGVGPHGWVVRGVLLSLFFAGTAAGNVCSLLLRRWWSRVEWSVEKQTRDEEAQRRFWGGKVRREDLWREQMEVADAEKPRKNVDVWERHRRLEKVKSDSHAGEVEEETDARERENDRSWCVRTLGCSAGLYALLGTLVGSARIHADVKRKVCGQMARRICMELFAPVGASGLDEPGHVGGFLFGCLVAGLFGW